MAGARGDVAPLYGLEYDKELCPKVGNIEVLSPGQMNENQAKTTDALTLSFLDAIFLFPGSGCPQACLKLNALLYFCLYYN